MSHRNNFKSYSSGIEWNGDYFHVCLIVSIYSLFWMVFMISQTRFQELYKLYTSNPHNSSNGDGSFLNPTFALCHALYIKMVFVLCDASWDHRDPRIKECPKQFQRQWPRHCVTMEPCSNSPSPVLLISGKIHCFLTYSKSRILSPIGKILLR